MKTEELIGADVRSRIGTDPTISGVLIVKNEERTIRRCLENLAPWVNQLVVLDTGSTDRTMEEVSRAKIRCPLWVGASQNFTARTALRDFHFAMARNEAKSHATGMWILSIDADETVEGDPDKLRARLCLIENEGEGAPTMQQLVLDNGRGTRCRVPRLFRREIPWTGRCHEVPDTSQMDGWDQGEWLCPEEIIRVVHEPKAEEKTERSHARNLALLERQHAEEAKLGWTTYLLGDCVYGLKNYFAAIGYLTAYLEGVPAKSYLVESRVHLILGNSWLHVGHLQNAAKHAHLAISMTPHLPRGYVLMSMIMENAGRLEAAAYYMEHCQKMPEPDPIHVNEREVYDPEWMATRLAELRRMIEEKRADKDAQILVGN